ncbi:sulfotransferase [Vibrio sp. SCSIO 43135]|uniref:sulfotransferase n=1 Tax=Vibrio sp. SCSIO 43135 TaxID=2819096 RepID=UPI0020761A8D|nr:sulfotransferase [Vibrio sp. SCSIO 43135]USD43117.1 sulfotransferase [Vibrio sp. SCSIO 43135]
MKLTSRNFFCKTSYLLDHVVARTQQTTPILISGFWRSGTTWVQEVMAQTITAKTMFEPLAPNTFLPLHHGLPVKSSAYLPLTSKVLTAEDLRLLDLSFSGVAPRRSNFNYLCRKTLQETLNRRVVVKLVRGQFLLPFLSERYDLPMVLHVSRHPMAVAFSMLRTNWAWNINEVDYSETYFREAKTELTVEQQDILNTLMEFSHETPERKVAALWALSEQFAYQQDCVRGFKYEELLQDPHTGFTAMANAVNQPVSGPIEAGKATAVTEADRKNIDTSARLHSWKEKLSVRQQNEIRSVLIDIWPEVTNQWEL